MGYNTAKMAIYALIKIKINKNISYEIDVSILLTFRFYFLRVNGTF